MPLPRGPPRLKLVHEPACDCRSACSDDEEPEHEGEQRIWLEPADDPKQCGSDEPDGEYVNVNQHSDIPSEWFHHDEGDKTDRPSRD